MWTVDPRLARAADAAGVDRIGVDIDTVGKAERQAGLGTWISPHQLDHLPAVGAVLRRARLFARLNPLHAGSAREVEAALGAGAGVLMLPMFHCPDEVAAFVDLVGGRAVVVGLLETPSALAVVDDVLAVPGLDELHIGINDLALALGLANRFLVLALDEVAAAAGAAAAAGMRFGAGGIGRAGDERFPIAADLVYAQLVRLGAGAALLSRSFTDGAADLVGEVRRARERLAWWQSRPPVELDAARTALVTEATRPGVPF